MNLPIEVRAFYKFVALPDYEERRAALLATMQEHHIKGTILLAHEGINGGIAGTHADVAAFCQVLCSYAEFEDLTFKLSEDAENPYDKAKVKLRKEIVTLGIEGIEPLKKQTGVYVSPKDWNQMLQDPEVLVVDTRNKYEIKMGTFKGALNPQTQHFREFPTYVQENLAQHKDKKIAMYCTGGIRCEKSTAYLLEQGFKSVYHLEGGILNYLETVPEAESMWEGDCFVFDNRVAVDSHLEKVPGAVSTKWD
ncbi:MAG: rhodanese-related sulfurtransferase [Gammaproteobacteria bacterium]|nr:rhodanese-related sulfurtransferase [Gammaproteobacteria bacterium]